MSNSSGSIDIAIKRRAKVYVSRCRHVVEAFFLKNALKKVAHFPEIYYHTFQHPELSGASVGPTSQFCEILLKMVGNSDILRWCRVC